MVRVYSFLLVLGLAGCTAKTPDSRISAVKKMAPDSWSASKEARSGVDSDWVKRFNDKQLSGLVAEAIASHPDMRAAAERMRQAEQAAYLAGAGSRIKSSISLDGNRDKRVFVGFPFGGSQISNSYALNWKVNWEPDLWGRVRAGASASIAETQAVAMDNKAARSSLAARVCKAWFALGEANEQLVLATQAYNIRKKTEDAIRDRFEASLTGEGGSASQLRLAQTDVATALAVKAQRQGEVEAAKRQLELLVGRYPAAKLKGGYKLPRIPSRPPAGIPSGVLQRRPDILAAERRYASAGKRITEARRAVFPIFKLTSSTGRTTDQLSKILSSQYGVWSIGADVSQNILTGGLVKGEVKTRGSIERQRLAELQSTVLKAFGEVETALAADRWIKRRIDEMSKAYKLAKDAADAADVDYAEGNSDALTVLTAQNRRIEIASQIVTLRRLYLDNRVNLHLALGGEYQAKGK